MPVRTQQQSSVVDWLFRDEGGRLVLAQAPNPALGVFGLATGLRLVTEWGVDTDRMLRGVAAGALMVWGLDELLRGATPFRRILGASVLAYQVIALAR